MIIIPFKNLEFHNLPDDYKIGLGLNILTYVHPVGHKYNTVLKKMKLNFIKQQLYTTIDLILGDLLQSVFSVVSAPDNTVQSKLVSLINVAGF